MRLPSWRPGLIASAWIAVAVGLLPWPGEYYMLVRIFFCGLSVYFLSQPVRIRDFEKWMLTGIAVLYNPIVPVDLGRGLPWIAVSVATVAYFQVLKRRVPAATHRWPV